MEDYGKWTVLCSKHIFLVFNLLELRKGMRSDDSITGYSKCHCFTHIIPANHWTLYTPLSLLPDVAHTALVWYKFVNSKSIQNEILCNCSMKSSKFTKLSLTASVNMALHRTQGHRTECAHEPWCEAKYGLQNGMDNKHSELYFSTMSGISIIMVLCRVLEDTIYQNHTQNFARWLTEWACIISILGWAPVHSIQGNEEDHCMILLLL